MANPWDQQEGEPDDRYIQFLMYLGMGPSRSLRSAYRVYLGESIAEQRRRKVKGYRRSAGSQWFRWCKQWQWVDRAHAYDRAKMIQESDHTMAKLMRGIDIAALKCIRELERVKPKGWKQALEALTIVAALIPADSAREAALECDDGKPPINLITPD